MKKNLLSMLILSTSFLSTQSNAVEYVENGIGSVEISGLVTPNLRCELQNIAPIKLHDVQANNFADTHLANVDALPININFTNCSDGLQNIKLRVKNNGESILKNTAKDGSNVSVAILNADGNEIDLSIAENPAFKVNIDGDDNTASYEFLANYKKPDNASATPGQVTASLSFDVIYSDIEDLN
ncbi:fimbrial protein [Proteus sp. DFP240708]|uniref:fimbrial protein n=1 Tax=Proteus TaxID=583 RepID=UPI0018E4233B|nr:MULTISPECIES: fimbrial protein [Proteus]MBI6337465.1 fimbrial protein [Proteus sp. PR00224]MBI6407239.1 fimbrial protein [Proteus sp. PR00208]MBI6542371.1 fimbrial protein [Proteus vulgaris]